MTEDLLFKELRNKIRRDGNTQEEAKQKLIKIGADEDAVEEALEKHREKRLEPRTDEIVVINRRGSDSLISYDGIHESDRYWPALREYMKEEKGWGDKILGSIDSASTEVLQNLKHPGVDQFNVRGLVLGYVQSGKTANYTAVISKAADIGYQLFIVLSGMVNNLRRQTQERLEKELCGLNEEAWLPHTQYDQDFEPTAPANHMLGQIETDGRTSHTKNHLIVTKKNKTRLENLLDWLQTADDDILEDTPAILIDDEADQASLDVSRDKEERSTINNLITDILDELPKVSYIGYTATPFANVLINPEDYQDLYPRDFIISLEKPDGYFGSEKIFGREQLDQDDGKLSAGSDGHDLIRTVPEEEISNLQPRSQDVRESFTPEITDSLEQALRYYWLATAARRCRGQREEHSSMLIHPTLYVDPHKKYRDLLRDYKTDFLDRLKAGGNIEDELEKHWNQEQTRVPSEQFGLTSVPFEDIREKLEAEVRKTRVIMENGESDDRLKYGEGTDNVIVIGGNTLSRGLTLEGLVVSFFIRTSNNYDTLLQMGRWFGFRKGYEDLPRVWITSELSEAFFDLATVEQEIRYDIQKYSRQGVNPENCGVRIRTHPVLNVTSRLKKNDAVPAQLSYSGRRLQTIQFNHKDRKWLNQNLEATRSLLKGLQNKGYDSRNSCIGSGSNIIIDDVNARYIKNFLQEYQFHKRSEYLDGDLIIQYIMDQIEENQNLKTWNVGIVSKQTADRGTINLGLDKEVNLINRAPLKNSGNNYVDIKALMSTSDVVTDLKSVPTDLEGNLSEKTFVDLQEYRPEKKGLLLLYPIDKHSEPGSHTGNRKPMNAIQDLIGVALVFPEIENDTPQKNEREYITADTPDKNIESPVYNNIEE